MIYKICKRKKENNTHLITVLDFQIDKSDIDDYFEKIKFLNYFKKINFYKKMIVYNGITLKKYLENSLIEPNTDISEKIELANKYVYDLSGAFVSFTEYLEKRVFAKQSDKMKKEFENFKVNIFDKEESYRFWYYMRNYTTHYDVPFNKGIAKIIDEKNYLKIICNKEHLLQYKEWKHAKKDIQKMDDEIDILKTIEPLLVIATSIYLQTIFIFRDKITEANKYISELIKKYQISNDIVFMEFENEEYLKQGKGKIIPSRLNELQMITQLLVNNPNIKIKQ